MGSIRFSLDPDILDVDFGGAGIHWAIETGTWTGRTAALLASKFQTVWSIESDKCAYDRLPCSHSLPYTYFLHGDSGLLLPKILEGRTDPCFFWLDAHWFPRLAERGVPVPKTTPLLEELAALNQWPPIGESFIAIDDVHLFRDGNNKPDYVPRNWPTQADIDHVTRKWPHSRIELQDVLYFVPHMLSCSFSEYTSRYA